MFPKEKESNKHAESVHTGEDHTAGDFKCEECSYRNIFAANCLQRMLGFKMVKDLNLGSFLLVTVPSGVSEITNHF